jgi:DNA-binding NarL/FixJ family response regulator
MKVLVLDDHALIREALRHALEELDDPVLVLEAPDGRCALRVIADHPDLDLVLLDLNLPDRDGFSLLAELRQRHPEIAVVVVSASNDRACVARSLELGAAGFIPKTTSHEIMLSGLRLVLAGGIYIPPEILPVEDAQFHSGEGQSSAGRGGVLPEHPDLTERQIDVLALMMQGKGNKAIARVLDLSEQTVKNHVTTILKALAAANRTEAVIKASKLRLEAKLAVKS